MISRPRGKPPACNCFGSVERDSILVSCMIIRNVVLINPGGASVFVETTVALGMTHILKGYIQYTQHN